MKPTFALTTSAFAIIAMTATLSAPLVAQQRVQDFTLPPGGTPTPTPEVEGPANEAAGVEIAPRPVSTPTPTPAPTPTPTATSPAAPPQDNTAAPALEQSPTPTPSVTQPATVQAQTPAAAPLPSAPPANEPDENVTEATSGASPPPIALPTPEPIAASTSIELPTSAEDPFLPDWWTWVAGLLAALLAVGAGFWAVTRKRAVATPATIEPPIAPNSAGSQSGSVPIRADRLKTGVHVESMMRSVMMLTLKFNVELANRQERALRDVSVFADLISAKRSLTMDQQMASAHLALGEIGKTNRIGPHQMGALKGHLQLPLSEVEVFRQGQTPLCVPLLRLRVEAEGIDPQFHTFLIGLAALQPGGRLQPLPLSGPPGGFEGVQAKRLEATA